MTIEDALMLELGMTDEERVNVCNNDLYPLSCLLFRALVSERKKNLGIFERHCAGCGKLMDVSADQRKRTCSAECKNECQKRSKRKWWNLRGNEWRENYVKGSAR